MKELISFVLQNKRFFLLAALAGLLLRLCFVFFYPHVAGDTFIYGDIAKNWLNHGTYGVTDGPGFRPTLIRLPGYPAFLAAMFSVFGQDHYTAVMVVQALIDMNSCLVIAALALEMLGARAGKVAFLLASLCPFMANYTAAPLTETLAVACAAHALYYGVRGIKALGAERSGHLMWLLCGLWTSAGIYLRPDGTLLLAAFGMVLVALLFRSGNRSRVVVAGLVVLAASLAPLAPWALRNWHAFHVFQPLAPRYANDAGEFVPNGFNHWMKTWIVDYVSVEEIYWPVPGEKIDIDHLPQRAFDSQRQYETTEELFADYNVQFDIDPELDARFQAVARDREVNNPFRYYVWLPSLRITSMWMRPRTELLPVEARWWEISAHPMQSVLAIMWAVLNLGYLLAALRGWLKLHLGLGGALLVGFMVIRSFFLGSLENPEPRYMLECFPAVIVLAAGGLRGSRRIPDHRK